MRASATPRKAQVTLLVPGNPPDDVRSRGHLSACSRQAGWPLAGRLLSPEPTRPPGRQRSHGPSAAGSAVLLSTSDLEARRASVRATRPGGRAGHAASSPGSGNKGLSVLSPTFLGSRPVSGSFDPCPGPQPNLLPVAPRPFLIPEPGP